MAGPDVDELRRRIAELSQHHAQRPDRRIGTGSDAQLEQDEAERSLDRNRDGSDRQQKSGDDEDREAVAAAHEIALRRLTVRDRTRHELASDLERRQVPPAVAQAVLHRLEEVGLVNDARFAEQWVTSRSGQKRSSVSRMRYQLRQKGIAEETIDAALACCDLDDLETARDLARQRLRVLSGLAIPVEQRRLAAYLARRGFSTAVVARVVGEALD